MVELFDQIRNCKICIEDADNPLPHKPNPVVVMSKKAKIVICGQAPGNRVNQSGIPFTDPSGDRLRNWLGVDDNVFYDSSIFSIVPMGFCFPGLDKKGGDLPPRKECAKAWHESVFDSMPQLELFLLVGGYAQKYHLGKAAQKTVTQTVSNWKEYIDNPIGGNRFFPLPHPSWRNTGWIKKHSFFEEDLLPFLKNEVSKILV